MYSKLSDEMSSYIKDNLSELHELIRTLCAIPAPSNMEEKRAEFCKNWFMDAGFEDVYIDSALNAVARCNVTEKNEVVIFMAHTDTVFPDLEPMEFVEKDGKMCCPGVGDDTANLAVLMLAARYFLHSGKRPACGIVFAANSGEEGLGNLKGSRKLMQDYQNRVREVISLDGTLDGICNGAVGSERYRVTLKTEGGHSFGSFGNRNAIHMMSVLINMLYSVKVPQIGGSKTTYNVGLIEGGTSVNTIAQNAQMLFEYRSDSKECLEKMREIFNAATASVQAMGAEIEVELIGSRPCMGDVDPVKMENILNRAEAAIESVTGKAPGRTSGSTDCNIPYSLGIPAVCFGAYHGKGAHTRQEYIETDSLTLGFEVVMRFMGEYFG